MTNPMTTTDLPNNEPAVIYMQWYGIMEPEPLTPSMIDEATWCIQQIDGTDVKYYHEQTILALTARVEVLQSVADEYDALLRYIDAGEGGIEDFQASIARAALNAKDVTP